MYRPDIISDDPLCCFRVRRNVADIPLLRLAHILPSLFVLPQSCVSNVPLCLLHQIAAFAFSVLLDSLLRRSVVLCSLVYLRDLPAHLLVLDCLDSDLSAHQLVHKQLILPRQKVLRVCLLILAPRPLQLLIRLVRLLHGRDLRLRFCPFRLVFCKPPHLCKLAFHLRSSLFKVSSGPCFECLLLRAVILIQAPL